ncbi:MAG TPA: HK97-gp10 family putative phage morphogenesis protein [Streptosporangiaceae bacterium]
MATIVSGIPQTIAALERVQIEAKVAAPVASRAGGAVLAAAMIKEAPKRTGKLAGSVRITQEGDTTLVGATVPYDRFVQKGTKYMSAQPYGEVASDETKGGIVAAIAAVFRTAIH